jgi:sulfite reductase beta subunit-like hemoprotein
MPQDKTGDNESAKLTKVEGFKETSHGLYGDIGAELGEAKEYFEDPSVQLLKHHGTYQQDDRDSRTARKKAGEGRDWKFMLRTKFPGGSISAEQYLICDDLSGKYGQDDLRITSRQCFQFHGVVRSKLRPLIHDLNKLAAITSLGACGDVVRNTMAPAVADIDERYRDCSADLLATARAISDHFMPATKSYFDLWIDDEKVSVNDDGTVAYLDDLSKKQVDEPIYGKTYLPRKYKIAIGTDFDNSTDVFTNDTGIIAVTKDGKIEGYEIVVGGGLGYTHRKEHTYSRIATPFAFVSADEIIPVLEALVKVQRDNGGRADRRQARMKYLIDQWGMEKFRATVFEYAGREFDAPRGIQPTAQPDYLGWHKQFQDGLNYVGVWIENGRVRDFDGESKFKSGLRQIIERFGPSVRLTPHHNLVIANIKDADVDVVQAILDEHGIPTDKGITTIRRLEMACPALPFCGLALAEAERIMPTFMKALEDGGHGDADVLIRMSGCPNNCSRPRSAEIGVVGSGADRYHLYIGGDYMGTRLCELFMEKLTCEATGAVVNQLLDAWKADRDGDERFGDWSARVDMDVLRGRIAAPAQ